MLITDDDPRAAALELAHNKDDAAAAVVTRAEAYLAFLVPAPIAAAAPPEAANDTAPAADPAPPDLTCFVPASPVPVASLSISSLASRPRLRTPGAVPTQRGTTYVAIR